MINRIMAKPQNTDKEILPIMLKILIGHFTGVRLFNYELNIGEQLAKVKMNKVCCNGKHS